ncbi:MAG: proline dehydrogenase family protein [Verrucomicrobia bacterium]|nr:proline dehydrogenase family protein [Verrucomicrobiota bacterium]
MNREGETKRLAKRAIELARELQTRATELQTGAEQRQLAELDGMLHRPADKVTLTQLTDQAFRPGSARRGIDQFLHILETRGVPQFFPWLDRLALAVLPFVGRLFAGIAFPLAKQKMRRESARVILPAEDPLLEPHLHRRREAGLRVNINILGEALLGEDEAKRRLQRYLNALRLPDIEVISVKISTIYSQISPLAREHTVGVLCDRLEPLYRLSAEQTFKRPDGTVAQKMVYLDMEEYRDMHLTAEAFMRTLARPGLEGVRAGIVLQAYLPDAAAMQRRLNDWARARVAAGGAPIMLRLVKGANMEMERFEAAIGGWPQAPFQTKPETDANFKRMLREGMRAENLAAVHLGVGSHNLFDIAYALVLAAETGSGNAVHFEMLEGMANHQRRALEEHARDILLYAPACRRENFIYAIGYLIRRLDENTGPENFLRHAFRVSVDDPEWAQLERAFLDSIGLMENLPDTPRRTQTRLNLFAAPKLPDDWRKFINEPDTDFSLPQNSQWAEGIVAKWRDRVTDIPLHIAGENVSADRPVQETTDPSRPGTVVARHREATPEDLARAVDCAAADPAGWRSMSFGERNAILFRAAHEMRLARGDLIGAAMASGGKTIAEADPEVSEAIDFTEFYTRTAAEFASQPNLRARGKGVVVVVSPWNFPIAIPCGGVAAALAAGNTVLLKPASDTVLPAHLICDCFWRAGVPREALQLVPCAGRVAGKHLTSRPEVEVVILTGGTETAFAMLRATPAMNLLAETGGKNATIVTAMADRDQAIKHVLHSAFSHAGQKCSATSLLLLEREVYEDARFKEALRDAVTSLPVGSVWDLPTKMGPLIRPPADDLKAGIERLEPGEEWLVEPRADAANPCLVSPGVKWAVRPGAPTHLRELFGPVLSVMCFDTLDEAIDLIHQTGFGLTSGLETLDEREQRHWQSRVRAGNLYINRPTTGAIVLRQPFGGMGLSAFGPGIKAGGPNYVAQLMDFEESNDSHAAPDSQARPSIAVDWRDEPASPHNILKSLAIRVPSVEPALRSYALHARKEFTAEHDHARLLGQDNLRRYRPIKRLCICLHEDDSQHEIAARIGAAISVGCEVSITGPGAEVWRDFAQVVPEPDVKKFDRLRYAKPSRVPEAIRQAANEASIYIADTPVLAEGRLELLWYVEEQSLSNDYHRYGNLGARAVEPRQGPG